MEVLNKVLPLILTAIMSMNLSGCRSANDTTDNADATASTTTEAAAETDTTDDPFADVYYPLPDNITMDDLLNGIQINGKTLSLPTSLADIMALDDGFSYELNDPFHRYSSIEDSFDASRDTAFFNIFYNGKKAFMASMKRSDYTGNVENSPICAFVGGFSKYFFDDVGLDLLMFSRLTFDSSYSDIVDLLGDPHEIYGGDIFYFFADNDLGYYIQIGFTDDDISSSSAHIKGIDVALRETSYEKSIEQRGNSQ